MPEQNQYKVVIRVGDESKEAEGSSPLEALQKITWKNFQVRAEVSVYKGEKKWQQLYWPGRFRRLLQNQGFQKLFNKFVTISLE